jgi:predicted small secreted protein
MRKLLVAMVLAGFVLGLAGCETVKGVGRDMEKAGEAIQKSAD